MNREEFDSGVWQEFYEASTYSGAPDECSIHWPIKHNECACNTVNSFDMARELNELDEEADWTEYDERVLNEHWEMEAENGNG